MKTCTKCGEEKPLKAFFVRAESGKPRGECRDCTRIFKNKWDAQNKKRIAGYNKKWAQKDPENYRELVRRANARQRAKNPAKVRAAYQAWYRANPEKAVAATQRWLEQNPGWAAHYREENREQLKRKNRQWQLANPARVREKARRYQASRRGATPTWLSAIQLAQIQEFYEIAEALETQTGVRHHVDHIHALNGENFCGLHVPWNLQVLRYDENIRKSNNLYVSD